MERAIGSTEEPTRRCGPQEILRATESARRIGQAIAELPEISRPAIGEFMVSLRPHVLRGIEFRRVRGEVVPMESG